MKSNRNQLNWIKKPFKSNKNQIRPNQRAQIWGARVASFLNFVSKIFRSSVQFCVRHFALQLFKLRQCGKLLWKTQLVDGSCIQFYKIRNNAKIAVVVERFSEFLQTEQIYRSSDLSAKNLNWTRIRPLNSCKSNGFIFALSQSIYSSEVRIFSFFCRNRLEIDLLNWSCSVIVPIGFVTMLGKHRFLLCWTRSQIEAFSK